MGGDAHAASGLTLVVVVPAFLDTNNLEAVTGMEEEALFAPLLSKEEVDAKGFVMKLLQFWVTNITFVINATQDVTLFTK
ncbi:hypothetical protein E2562_038877 [Oryza meyeriana var. granulata]|uniref:Uncharacterized protein n=1 Tax=Oryza meyeriana var. granulata TaxID=110450 RepID=A0A6G1CNA0_9ORYZ|nr:hypothetical protein E2562_038877 [Oryza meyeriana var. granulata]